MYRAGVGKNVLDPMISDVVYGHFKNGRTNGTPCRTAINWPCPPRRHWRDRGGPDPPRTSRGTQYSQFAYQYLAYARKRKDRLTFPVCVYVCVIVYVGQHVPVFRWSVCDVVYAASLPGTTDENVRGAQSPTRIVVVRVGARVVRTHAQRYTHV